MRLRVLFGVASVMAVVGMLWGSAGPVGACLCIDRSTSEYVSDADMIALGRVLSFTFHEDRAWVRPEDDESAEIDAIFSGEAIVEVERYLLGSGPRTLVIGDDTACGPITKDAIGSQLLFINRYGERLVTSRCLGSGQMAPRTIQEVEAITGPGEEPRSDGVIGGRGGDFPWAATVALAVVGPLAFLFGAAFLWRRGEPHNG
jgi:hypothetical protein